MAKELSRQTATRVELGSLNPAHPPRTLPPREIAWMARIVWVTQ
jgi:phage repressor protein C with HTH and peptisase S24 domain